MSVSTKLLYLKDMSLRTSLARIVAVDPLSGSIVLDQSPFYPQGGGQASDKGTLSVGAISFDVAAVKKDPGTGNISHFISSSVHDWNSIAGAEVVCHVDPLTRDINSRCHSAGHLLDHAVEDLHLPLEVLSAYHFIAGPYVEYAFVDDSVELTPEYLKDLQGKLQETANKIVEESIPVTVYDGNVCDLPSWRQDLIPEAVRLSGSVRLVKFEKQGYDPVPCSGTHVTNSAQIKPIVVRKISLNREKRTIRVSYVIQQ